MPHPSPPPPRRSQHLRDEYISDLINYTGSDDSDNSDEEGEIAAPLIQGCFYQNDDKHNAGDPVL